MIYLLDTDHFSILQRQTGAAYANLATRMGQHTSTDFAVSIVTFHEQVMGAHARIQNAKNEVHVLEGYEFLQRAFVDYTRFAVLPFDRKAQDTMRGFAGSLRIGQRDQRIASIALANELTLLTRNNKDFERIPRLRIEDWSTSAKS